REASERRRDRHTELKGVCGSTTSPCNCRESATWRTSHSSQKKLRPRSGGAVVSEPATPSRRLRRLTTARTRFSLGLERSQHVPRAGPRAHQLRVISKPVKRGHLAAERRSLLSRRSRRDV